jgi:hypothetical protein
MVVSDRRADSSAALSGLLSDRETASHGSSIGRE